MAGSIKNIRKKFHTTHELISTSYHEAGHTVYGLLHHLKINSVWVFEDKKTKRIHGFTQYDPPDLSEIEDVKLFNDRLHAEICLSYAGLVAEKKYFKMISGSDNLPMFLREGSSNDFSEAAELFQKYSLCKPGRDRYNYKQKLIKQVGQELQEHWEDVSIISHKLFKSKRINFLELKSLLIRKSEYKDFWKKQFKELEVMHNDYDELDEKEQKIILSL